jgi:hypothetical protein
MSAVTLPFEPPPIPLLCLHLRGDLLGGQRNRLREMILPSMSTGTMSILMAGGAASPFELTAAVPLENAERSSRFDTLVHSLPHKLLIRLERPGIFPSSETRI